KNPPPPSHVRRASIEALMNRFRTCDAARARSRARVADKLLHLLDPGADFEVRETLQHACLVLDAGRAVDYFDRFRNAAMLVAARDLQGFTPRTATLLFATLAQADSDGDDLGAFRSLRDKDRILVRRAAILLRIADEIERRTVPGKTPPVRMRSSEAALMLV